MVQDGRSCEGSAGGTSSLATAASSALVSLVTDPAPSVQEVGVEDDVEYGQEGEKIEEDETVQKSDEEDEEEEVDEMMPEEELGEMEEEAGGLKRKVELVVQEEGPKKKKRKKSEKCLVCGEKGHR